MMVISLMRCLFKLPVCRYVISLKYLSRNLHSIGNSVFSFAAEQTGFLRLDKEV